MSDGWSCRVVSGSSIGGSGSAVSFCMAGGCHKERRRMWHEDVCTRCMYTICRRLSAQHLFCMRTVIALICWVYTRALLLLPWCEATVLSG